ncbi:MAG: DUF917 domain-containing protein [Rhizobiales bacterium]|nr:DUF917 domain-containing protein [Hyphomicrobiales bacterium]NRB15588.1 DUF917 domain-containing protein [Hyphomicrobiales bacterium]
MIKKSIDLVDEQALKYIAAGGAVLGAGGGGDPYVGRLMAMQEIRKTKPVRVIDIDELDDDDFVLPIAMVGAPTVMLEKFPSGNEIPKLVAMMEQIVGKKVRAIMCIEAGGLNSVIPFIAAAQMDLPIIDGDGMGRAFPEIQMVSFTLAGIKATPFALMDDKGNGATFDTIDNSWTERLVRVLAMEMGGSVMSSMYPMSAKQCKSSLVRGSLSLAHDIGKMMSEHGADACQLMAETYNGIHLFQGRVRDVERKIEGGWQHGVVKLEGIGDFRNREVSLEFKNEFLIAKEGKKVLATTPDLITLLDAFTGQPVTTELVKYGLPVNVLGLPCDPIWRTPAGIELSGPKYFGYDVEYSPI